jgi:hypothetical protein
MVRARESATVSHEGGIAARAVLFDDAGKFRLDTDRVVDGRRAMRTGRYGQLSRTELRTVWRRPAAAGVGDQPASHRLPGEPQVAK